MVERLRIAVAALASMTLMLPTTASASVQDAREATAAMSDVRLRVPSGLPQNDPVTRMSQIGSIPVDVTVSRLSSGQARVATNLWGGKGVRFPAYTGRNDPPRAVLRVNHRATTGDPFAPRERDFSFGIYFKKDATSTGTPVDNGDNLLQRGLASDPSQFKLEVDSGRPECTVKGNRGQVIVRSSVTLDSRLWYQATCTRTGNTVRVAVKEYRSDGSTRTVTTSRSGATGSLVWPKRGTPMSVGGKLAANGSVIRSATDQFNGLLTNPTFEITG